MPEKPTGSLSDVVAMPYCDNITILGSSQASVDSALKSMVSTFSEAGFELHEIEWASTERAIPGGLLDGCSGTVRPKPERAWRLAQAMRAVARGFPVSGREFERLLGHFVFEALFQRPLLAIMRAC